MPTPALATRSLTHSFAVVAPAPAHRPVSDICCLVGHARWPLLLLYDTPSDIWSIGYERFQLISLLLDSLPAAANVNPD